MGFLMRRSPWWPGIAAAAVLAVTAATAGTATASPTAAASHPATAAPASTKTAAKTPTKPAAPAPLTMDQASAQAKRTGQAVNVDAVETATTTLTADPDGGFTVDTNAVPVRAKVAGSWHPLDATLHRSADGTVRPALTGLDLALSGGGKGPLATLSSGADSLSLTLPTALPAPVLSGDQATYPNVVRGIDLVVTASAQGGFSDVFVVHDAAAAASPALAGLLGASVTTHGLSVSADATGALRAVDSRGATVFSAAPAAMWDSAATSEAVHGAASSVAAVGNGATSSVTAAGHGAHRGRLAASLSGGVLRLAPDKTMLADPHLAFPLYLDPSWTGGRSDWATPASDFAASPYWNKSAESAGQMQVGMAVGGGLWADTLVNFNLPLNLLGAEGTRSDIVAATFNATVTASSDCTPDTVDVFAPSKTLTQPNSDWNDWFTSGGRGGTLGGRVGQNTKVPGKWNGQCSGGSTGWGLSTGWITNDVNSGKSLQTLALAGDSYSDEQNEAVYDLFDPASPQLSVKFFHAPAVGPLTTSPNAAIIGRGDVILDAKVSDPDGGTLPVAFTAEVNGNSSEIIKSGTVSNPNNSTAPLLVAQSLLDAADAKYGTAGSMTVTWTATATATDSDVSPPATMSTTASGKFVYDNAIPGAPDVWSDTADTPCQGAAGYTPGIGATFQVSVPSGQTLPTSYSYQINDSAPVTTNAVSGLTPITIVPTGFANLLTVREINVAGTVGQAASCTFFADHNPPNAAPGDLTGDGVADLLVPGQNTAPLPAGLWLAPGTPAGTPSTAVTDIGSAGTGISTTQNPGQWTGVQTTTGMFQGAGYNDVMAYDPAANSTAECVGNVLYPFGQTLPLQPFSGQEGTVAAAVFTYYNYDPTGITFTTSCAGSVANGGNLATAESSGTTATTSATPSFPDLLLVAGGSLYLAPEQGTVGAWPSLGGNNSNSVASGDYLLSTAGPEGGSWSGWTVTTTLVDDLPAMFAISPAGKVYYYSPTAMAELACDSADPGVGALNSGCQRYTVAPSAALTTLAPYAQVQAATIGGTVELWVVGADGTVQPWSLDAAGDALTQGSTTVALGTAAHHWPLNDCTTTNSNAATAADFGGGTHLALGGVGGATWTTDDVLGGSGGHRPCDVLLNGSSGALSTGSGNPALDPTGPFTVSAWADPTAYGGTLVSQTGGTYGEFTISEGTGGWSFSLNKGPGTANTFDTITGGPVTLFSWTQITATYDGSTARLYVNGALVASGGHAPGSKGTNNALVIGAAQTNNALAGFFNGQVADVSVLKVAAGPAVTPPMQPAGLWALNEGSGSTAGDLGTGNHPATVASGASWGPGSLTMNGSSPGAATASSVLNTASSYTVSAWVMLQNTSGWHTAVSQDGNVDSGFFLQYDVGDDRWALSGDSGDVSNPTAVRALSSAPPSIGVWTHLAGVYNSSARTLTLFVNGVQQGTVSYTTAFATTGPLAIGRGKYNGHPTDYFAGNVADVRLYPAALQAGQISWLDQHGIYAPATATGSVVNRPLNKCLDDLNRTLVQGAIVDSYDCNGSAAQTWTTNADGAVTTGGWCLDTVGGGTANTVKTQLSTCSGSATQRWTAQTDTNGYVHLVNAASGRCLDDPGATVTNATQMQIYDCLNNYNQTWEPQYRTNVAAGQTATSSSADPSTTTNWAAANLTNGVYRQSPNVAEFSSAGSSTAANEQWAQIDLGSVQPVDEIDLYPRDDTVPAIADGFPVNFTLQTSTDGSSWQTVVTKTGYAKPGDVVQPFPFGVVSARYVRVDATQLSDDQYGVYYLQLRQMAVRGR
jgi:hypothetical protein